MPTQTHPRSAYAGTLFDRAVKALGSVVAGTRWMFSGQPELKGASPIQALIDGRDADVEAALTAIERQP